MKQAVSSPNWLVRFFRFYWGRGIADDVPALTYFLVLSLAPFALGLTALGALIFGDHLSPLQVTETIAPVLPDAIEDDVVRLVLNTRQDSPFLLTLAIAAMLWTTGGAIGVVERVLSRFLDAPRYPIVWGRLRNTGMGGLVAIVLTTAAAATSFGSGVLDYIPHYKTLLTYLLPCIHLVGSICFCAFMYRFVTKGRIRWKSAFGGAVFAGAVLQLAPLLLGLYFSKLAGFSTGQLFFALAVVLGGCFMMAQGLLIGAGIAARVEQRADERSQTKSLDDSANGV
jgi:uncharacterized BrkB/YihY/UPF0761 family membrane protein